MGGVFRVRSAESRNGGNQLKEASRAGMELADAARQKRGDAVVWLNKQRADIMADIATECQRQQDLYGGKPNDLRDPDTPIEHGSIVLLEEVGEVARALLDGGLQEDRLLDAASIAHLKEEIVQCAAVCVAWLEGIG